MIIFLVPFFSRRRCTNQLQMEKSLWTACVRKRSCLALKLTRYNVKKIKKFLLIDEKCIFFFFLTIWDLCLLVMLLVINFSFFLCFRVWFLYQDQTMNRGAKAWMDWHQDPLNTTSKVLDLLSGKSFGVLMKIV